MRLSTSAVAIVGTVITLAMVAVVAVSFVTLRQASRPRPPLEIGEPSLASVVVEWESDRFVIQDADGRIREVVPVSGPLVAHPPISVPEVGDLFFTARIDGEEYHAFAGRSQACEPALKFRYAFDEPQAIVGVLNTGFASPGVGLRFPKSTGFQPVHPPDDGLWLDYYVLFCVNEAGEITEAHLISLPTRPLAGTPS